VRSIKHKVSHGKDLDPLSLSLSLSLSRGVFKEFLQNIVRKHTFTEPKSITWQIAGATSNLGSKASTTGCKTSRQCLPEDSIQLICLYIYKYWKDPGPKKGRKKEK